MKETKSYCVTNFGNYAEGLGTLRASGGDIGGGSEILIVYELPESDRMPESGSAPRLV